MTFNKRIGIIGAGAAGLSAAHYLKNLGYQNITLFEASDRVGGKCCSIEIDGHVFDIGAVIATMGYNQVLALAEEYQVPLTCAPKLYYKSIETSAQRRLGVPQVNGFASIKALYDFTALLIQTRASRTPGHHHLEFNLAKNINEWLREHQLENIQEIFMPAFTGFGYGYKEYIPAAYLFKMSELTFADSLSSNWHWFKSAYQCLHKEAFKDRPFQLTDLIEPLMFERGYQSLFEAMATKFDIRLNTAINSIDVSGNIKTLTDNNNHSHQFEQVIIATPPDVIARLATFDSNLSDLFKIPKTLNYHVFLTEFKNPMEQEAWFIPENTLTKDGLGRPVVVSRVSPTSDIGTCYAYSDSSISATDLENHLEEDCDRLGVGLKSIRKQKRWNYFPHVDAENFNAFYQKLENLQGKQGIYFAGETANFTTVEHVVCYSQALVKRFF